MLQSKTAVAPMFGRVRKGSRLQSVSRSKKVEDIVSKTGMSAPERSNSPKRKADEKYLSPNGKSAETDGSSRSESPIDSVSNDSAQTEYRVIQSSCAETGGKFDRAASVLSLGHMPLRTCSVRESESSRIFSLLQQGVDDCMMRGRAKPAASIYVCGTPGSGKTVTVGKVVHSLLSQRCLTQLAAAKPEFDTLHSHNSAQSVSMYGLHAPQSTQIQGIWISCAGVQTASQLYDLIAERMGVQNGLDGILRFVHGQGPLGRERRAVLVLDEIDFMPANVLYTVFDWPKIPGSLLSVVGIANSIDLPFKALPWLRAANRMPDVIPFRPYTSSELTEIVEARLLELSDRCLPQAAVQLAAKKVAAGSGDARLVLDVCRDAVSQLAQSAATFFTTARAADESGPSESTNPALAVSVVSNILDLRGGATTVVSTIRSLPLQQQLILCVIANAEKQWPDFGILPQRLSSSSGSKNAQRKLVSHHATLGVLHNVFTSMCRKLRVQTLSFSDFADICCTTLAENHGLLHIFEKTKPRGKLHASAVTATRSKIARLNAISVADVQAGVSDKELLSLIVGKEAQER